MRLSLPSFKIEKSYEVAFSPSGRLLATVGPIQVNVWDVTTGKRLASTRALKNSSSVAFSPDEASISIKNTVGELCIVDIATAAVRLVIREKVDDEGCAPIYTPDGKYIIDGSWDGFVYVWDTRTGECVYSREFPDCMIQNLAYCPSTERYAVSVWAKTEHSDQETGDAARVYTCKWSLDSEPWTDLPKRWDNLWQLAWSPDGSMFAIITGELYMSNVVEIIDAHTGDMITRFLSDDYGNGKSLDWSPDGKMLAWAGGEHFVVFSAPGLHVLASVDTKFAADVRFSPNGRLLAMGAWRDGVVMSLDHLGLSEES